MRKHALITVGGQVGIQAIGVATGIIVARLLGPAGRGQLAAIIAWVSMIAYVGDLGLPVAYTYRAARRPGIQRDLVGNAVLIVVAQWAILAAVGTWALRSALGGQGAPTIHLAIVYLWVYLPLNLLTRYANAIQRGAGDYTSFNAVRLCVPVTYIVFLGSLVALGHTSVGAVVAANLLANAATLVLATVLFTSMLRRQSRRTIDKGRWFDPRALMQDLRYGLSAHIGTLQPFNRLRVDVLVLTVLLSAHDVGLYMVALAGANLLRAQGFAFGLIAMPEMARERDPGRRKRTLFRLGGATAVITGAAAVVALVWARPLLRLVYGADFTAAAPILRVMVVGGTAAALYRVLGDGLRGAGYPLRSTVAEVIGLAVGVPALAILTPLAGATGAAVAVAMASFVSLGVVAHALLRTNVLSDGTRMASTAHSGRPGP